MWVVGWGHFYVVTRKGFLEEVTFDLSPEDEKRQTSAGNRKICAEALRKK
jgi:hypothetical protein